MTRTKIVTRIPGDLRNIVNRGGEARRRFLCGEQNLIFILSIRIIRGWKLHPLIINEVGSKNVQTQLETLPQGFATTPRSTYNTGIVTVPRSADAEISTAIFSGTNEEHERVSRLETSEDTNGEEQRNDDENEENVTVDEYEDELRGIAESHEAMSRDERRNGISASTLSPSSVNENRSFGDRLRDTKNFDSRENADEINSDESSGSNEAMPANEDEEVAELLKYKQRDATLREEEEVAGGIANPSSKVKRVPTVKKELSTQKEILAINVTDILPKTLGTSVEIVNRLDDERKQETRYAVPVAARDPNRYELVRGDLGLEEEYADVDTSADFLRKLDKRQPSELNSLRSGFLGGYNSEHEQQRKLQELGIEEGVLAESLMELLTRLAEDPQRWERVHRLLKDVEGDLVLSQTSLLDSRKRSYTPVDSPLEVSLTETSTDSPVEQTTTKKPKKKKKKKKKPRNRLNGGTSTLSPTPLTTTSSSSTPLTPTLLTTTESTWPTTPAQWRLVAERLFGSPWSDDRRETPSSSLAKVRYAATAKQRGTTVKERLLPIDDKQRESLKALNDERQALMLQSAREYSQPRRLHYGKVNTHEKGSPDSSNHEDGEQNYGDTGSAARVMDYDISERNYQQRPISMNRYDRYGQYAHQRSRDYGMSSVNQNPDDYDDMFRYPDAITNHRPFARTQPFRPLGREYASTKTWQDSRYDYGRPWKDKSRTNYDGIPSAGGHWPWRAAQSDYKVWIPRYQHWGSRDRNNWQRYGNNNEDDDTDPIEDYEDNENPLPPRNWQRNSPQQQTWRNYPSYSVWPIDRNVDVSSSWSSPERSKSYTREIIPGNLEKSKNLSELSNKESGMKTVIKDKPVLPKITMKTWNSLTSDPATWPFKLTGAKPWPKDKNGKSYNPNAELVRKLGLDKQDRLLATNKSNNKENGAQLSASKYGKIDENIEKITLGKNEKGSIADTAKSSISWPAKLSTVNEWSKSREKERLPQRDEARTVWQGNVESDRKMWSGKSPVSPKISSVGAWVMPADQSTWRPYELKQTAYGQLSDVPRVSYIDGTGNGASWSMQDSQTWPHKINNDWNVQNSGYSSGKPAPTSRSSTWPSKWRQFAYHKVTAAPITKPGATNLNEGSGKSRNSYIAVSAVAAPKYSNNDWRKNDIEETQLDRSSNGHGTRYDPDDPSSQLRKGAVKGQWDKQTRTGNDKGIDRNDNDPLEHQLEELRQVPYWNRDQLREQKRSNASGVSPITVISTQASHVSTNSSSSGSVAEKRFEGSTPTATQTDQKIDARK